MITLYCFGRVNPAVYGETRDLRAQWALEELGLPYRIHGLDHTGGELDSPTFTDLSPFHLLPVIDDEGFIVSESGAVLLYLAEKAGKITAADVKGRTELTQWCFSALCTVERPMSELLLIDHFGGHNDANKRREEMVQTANRWFEKLEKQLQGRDWIVSNEFTVADILLATVLREVRTTNLMDRYPRVKSYYARAMGRPSWQRTLKLYAERLGVEVSKIA